MNAVQNLTVVGRRFRRCLVGSRTSIAAALAALMLAAAGCLTPDAGAGDADTDPNSAIVTPPSDSPRGGPAGDPDSPDDPSPEPSPEPSPTPRPQPDPQPEPEPQPQPEPDPQPQPNPDPLPLPAGALQIIALGDSVTEGTADTVGGGYPARLQDQVAAVRPGSTMVNLGRYGWTSGELIAGLDPEPSQLDAAVAAKPDVALVWIGSNDLWRLYEFGPLTGTTAADEQASLDEYRRNMETIVSRLTDAGAQVYVGLLDDQSLRPVREDRGTLPNTTPAEFDQMSALVDEYNQVIRDVADRYDAATVDFFNTTIFTSDTTLDFDGIHPNAAGYDVIAEMWFAALGAAE